MTFFLYSYWLYSGAWAVPKLTRTDAGLSQHRWINTLTSPAFPNCLFSSDTLRLSYCTWSSAHFKKSSAALHSFCRNNMGIKRERERAMYLHAYYYTFCPVYFFIKAMLHLQISFSTVSKLNDAKSTVLRNHSVALPRLSRHLRDEGSAVVSSSCHFVSHMQTLHLLAHCIYRT